MLANMHASLYSRPGAIDVAQVAKTMVIQVFVEASFISSFISSASDFLVLREAALESRLVQAFD